MSDETVMGYFIIEMVADIIKLLVIALNFLIYWSIPEVLNSLVTDTDIPKTDTKDTTTTKTTTTSG